MKTTTVTPTVTLTLTEKKEPLNRHHHFHQYLQKDHGRTDHYSSQDYEGRLRTFIFFVEEGKKKKKEKQKKKGGGEKKENGIVVEEKKTQQVLKDLFDKVEMIRSCTVYQIFPPNELYICCTTYIFQRN